MRDRRAEFRETLARAQARWATLTLREPRAKYRAGQEKDRVRQERRRRRRRLWEDFNRTFGGDDD
jgi:hypothetical protein